MVSGGKESEAPWGVQGTAGAAAAVIDVRPLCGTLGRKMKSVFSLPGSYELIQTARDLTRVLRTSNS